jgi:hypothetical protein
VDHSKFEFKGEMGPWTVADQLAKLTHWNGGRNHLVLEIHDSERMRYDIGTIESDHTIVYLEFDTVTTWWWRWWMVGGGAGKAMGVKSGFAAEWYRLGFDISFPLYAQASVNETAVELSNRRGGFATRPSKYLLTFKGGNNRRYLPRPYHLRTFPLAAAISVGRPQPLTLGAFFIHFLHALRHRLRPKVRARLDDPSRGTFDRKATAHNRHSKEKMETIQGLSCSIQASQATTTTSCSTPSSPSSCRCVATPLHHPPRFRSTNIRHPNKCRATACTRIA